MITNSSTVKQAKDELLLHLEEGAKCYVCNQNVKLYKRKIHRTMARGLLALYKAEKSNPNTKYHHITDFAPTTDLSADFSKLRHFGLVEEMPNTDVHKHTSGYWKITPLGYEFIYLETKVRAYVKVYNKKVLGIASKFVDIKDVLGNKYSYAELMK